MRLSFSRGAGAGEHRGRGFDCPIHVEGLGCLEAVEKASPAIEATGEESEVPGAELRRQAERPGPLEPKAGAKPSSK